MRNWLIKLLGGYTWGELDAVAKVGANLYNQRRRAALVVEDCVKWAITNSGKTVTEMSEIPYENK